MSNYKTSDIVLELKQMFCVKREQCDGEDYCPFYIFPKGELALKNSHNQNINICTALGKIIKAIEEFENEQEE